MVVANELLKQGFRVEIFERAERMGGKAGASYFVDNNVAPGAPKLLKQVPDPGVTSRSHDKARSEGGRPKGNYEEHGYHVFPSWYANTLDLIREAGILKDLVPITKFYYLVPSGNRDTNGRGIYPHYIEFHQLDSIASYAHNIFSGIVPWHEAALSFYAVLDLCSQSLDRKRFLDRVSVNGFLRSRYYASDIIAQYHQQTVLQASSIPNYELSAMTMKNLVQHWSGEPTPLFRIFNGNLQEKFIDPITVMIEKAGAKIHLMKNVAKLATDGKRVRGLEISGSVVDDPGIEPVTKELEAPRVELLGKEDICVVATPLEVTRSFSDGMLFALEERSSKEQDDVPSLGVVHRLTSAPMASFQFYFGRTVPDIPAQHVNLFGSRYGLSFIDVSQVWDGIPHTALSVIAADFEPLKGLSQQEAAERILEDIHRFVPGIETKVTALQDWHAELNINAPLFLNSVGAWPFRPATRTRLENVYVAGDYCRSQADLTTMESAVISARNTAAAILQDWSLPAEEARPKVLRNPYKLFFKPAKWLLLPGAYALRFGADLLIGRK